MFVELCYIKAVFTGNIITNASFQTAYLTLVDIYGNRHIQFRVRMYLLILFWKQVHFWLKQYEPY